MVTGRGRISAAHQIEDEAAWGRGKNLLFRILRYNYYSVSNHPALSLFLSLSAAIDTYTLLGSLSRESHDARVFCVSACFI